MIDSPETQEISAREELFKMHKAIERTGRSSGSEFNSPSFSQQLSPATLEIFRNNFQNNFDYNQIEPGLKVAHRTAVKDLDYLIKNFSRFPPFCEAINLYMGALRNSQKITEEDVLRIVNSLERAGVKVQLFDQQEEALKFGAYRNPNPYLEGPGNLATVRQVKRLLKDELVLSVFLANREDRRISPDDVYQSLVHDLVFYIMQGTDSRGNLDINGWSRWGEKAQKQYHPIITVDSLMHTIIDLSEKLPK